MIYRLLDDIHIGDRLRTEVGDLTDLKDSIREHGLLHPVVIDDKDNLVAGYRRIQAYKEMGLDSIAVNVVSVANIFKAQVEENQIRKDFTYEEEMRIADFLEPLVEKEAAERELAGVAITGEPYGNLPEGSDNNDGMTLGDYIAEAERGQTEESDEEDQPKSPTKGNTRDIMAKSFGESGRTYEKKRKIWGQVQAGVPAAVELKEKIEKGQKSIESAWRTLQIHDRRQNLRNFIATEAEKRPLPEGLTFGNCFELMAKLPDKSVDSVVTSPPFDQPISFMRDILNALSRVVIDYAIIFNSSLSMHEIIRETNPFRTMIWYKQITQETFRFEPIFVYKFITARFNINGNITRDVFPFSPPEPQERDGEGMHRDENPPELYEELIKLTSGTIIMDPFVGSGTTLKVCNKLGIKCIAYEINRKYEAIIKAPLPEKKPETSCSKCGRPFEQVISEN